MSISVNKPALGVTLFLLASLLLVACGSSTPASSSGNAVDVQVTLSEFKIDSSLTTFSVEVPYHFVVTNKGTVNHQLVIMPPTAGDVSTAEVQKMMLAGIDGDGMAAGTTQSFDYTFTQAYPAGKLEMACHLPGHYDAGMRLGIVVN
jgi:uncharacterized cupredoxin-like copper-binding protein